MLPPTTTSEDENNAANLNAAFVTDNSLEQAEADGSASASGNIEAETNKPEDDDDAIEEQDQEQDQAQAATTDVEPLYEYSTTLEDEEAAGSDALLLVDDQEQEDREYAAFASRAVAHEGLTIENNEAAEVNDNFNESAHDDDDDDDDAYDASLAATTTTATTTPEQELAETVEEFGGLGVGIVDDAEESSDEDAMVPRAVVHSGATHSNYGINEQRQHHREDVSSSDDEDGGAGVEMNAAFNSEWAHLAEDLALTHDRHNELSNDIDAYDTVPIDLSNDIAVNDIAAAQPDFPLNPDAEVIDVAAVAMMPQFERLSMDTPPGHEHTHFQAYATK